MLCPVFCVVVLTMVVGIVGIVNIHVVFHDPLVLLACPLDDIFLGPDSTRCEKVTAMVEIITGTFLMDDDEDETTMDDGEEEDAADTDEATVITEEAVEDEDARHRRDLPFLLRRGKRRILRVWRKERPARREQPPKALELPRRRTFEINMELFKLSKKQVEYVLYRATIINFQWQISNARKLS